ncbi:MAG: cytochrome c4 [Pseudomonadales bacterium]|jgi:cytochrome c553|nr:cytochrome c4 [Pseudomonadales bacterium]MBP6228074.1 cytochrome c4 [Pseudomonadales bacterium]
MTRIVCMLIFTVLCGTPVWAAGDAATGKALYASCAACHGVQAEGIAAMNAPALAGQEAAYIERQLAHFQAGVRGADPADTLGAQMRGMAAVLADTQAIADVSAYLAALAPMSSASDAGGDLRNGNNYYQSKCGACHGGKAEGNAALFAPRLAGQDVAYLKRQYLNFQQGLRGSHAEDRFGKQMKMMSTTLPGEKDLDDVLAFINAQGAAR